MAAGTITTVSSQSVRAVTAAPASANGRRFLALTDASRAAGVGRAAPSGMAAGKTDPSQGKRPSCGTGPSTPAGWCLTPAGSQFDVLRFPIGLTVDPTSGDAVVSSDSGGAQAIAVVNPSAPDPRAAVTFAPGANLFLGLSLTPTGKLYASGGNADRVFRYQLAGPVAIPEDATQAIEVPTHNATNGLEARIGAGPQAAPVADGIHVAGYPGESLSDPSHNLILVGGTLSEPSGAGTEQCPGSLPSGQPVPACARVSVIDTSRDGTGADPVVRRIAVGADTYGLGIDSVHNQLFVANWGDQASRGNGLGTVSVLPLDPRTGMPGPEAATIAVGHHPEAVALSHNGEALYVTDTNDDTVTIISTATRRVLGVIDVGIPGHRVGTQPDAIAVSPDGTKLFVALAGLNAIQVVGIDPSSGRPGGNAEVSYVPTGWYPSAIAAVPGPGGHGTRLWVANAKGVGFGPGANGSVLFEGTTTGGTVSMIDLPADPAPALRSGTRAVITNNGLDENPDPCAPELHPSPVLCPASGRSPIQHVLYIVAENKTFDSYFGDINSGRTKGYDASPAFVLFGQPVTTNQHALATGGTATLGDNFYSDAEVSVTGHSFTSGALATDHNEKTWPADYDQGVRGTHGNGDPLRPSVGSAQQSAAINNVENALYDPQGGFVFEQFVAKGAVDPATKEQNPAANPLSMAIYGEHSTSRVGPAFHAKGGTTDWKAGDIQYFDSCRAKLFITGHAAGGGTPDTDQTRDCENRTLDPQFTLGHWESVYAATHQDVMPNFIYMSLPDNHTLGTNLGSPTPQSMVADNDYAIGTIVEALSQSPFWSSTAVVVVQDDTQATGDHVNPLRDTLEVIGPWSSPTPNHQRGSMGSVLHTIEMLFGVDPVGINDRLAAPLHGAFVSSLAQEHSNCNATATLRDDGTYATPCYRAVRPVVPFAINQLGAPGQAASMAMNWSQVDRIDMATLNAIWRATQRHVAFQAPPTHVISRDADG